MKHVNMIYDGVPNMSHMHPFDHKMHLAEKYSTLRVFFNTDAFTAGTVSLVHEEDDFGVPLTFDSHSSRKHKTTFVAENRRLRTLTSAFGSVCFLIWL